MICKKNHNSVVPKPKYSIKRQIFEIVKISGLPFFKSKNFP